ncbi:hypothetical protein [Nocardioides ochotonae]|uniref:hypothetical protein n=1 Tax=Nocardioides ochotonae TaxID=2685869 RepID=UPI00140D7173|nr:hypothetical protein [Nocardioides ochotonae]
MNARVQLSSSGGSANLSGGYLRARLIGDVQSTRLLAQGAQGNDLVHVRDSAHSVVLTPTSEPVSLLVVPAAGGEFHAGTRIGLEIQVVTDGGSSTLPTAAEVARLDIGGFRRFELASASGDSNGWILEAGMSESSPFDFLMEAKHVVRLDEREQPWVVPGRYVLRSERQGEDVPASGRTWALVLDSSASFLHALDAAEVAEVARVLAGLMAEETGLTPSWLGATGLLSPVRAGKDPAAVAESLDPGRPASWCLAAPAAAQAIAAGARTVVFLGDSVPSDLREMGEELEKAAGEAVVVLVSREGGERLLASSGGERAHGTHLAELYVQPLQAAHEWDWSQVCRALTGVSR